MSKSPKDKDINVVGSVNKKGSRSEEKPKAKRSLENKLNEKTNTKKRSLSIGKKLKKDESSAKKGKKRLMADDADDIPLAKLAKKPKEDKDDDSIILATLKKTLKKKKVRPENGTASEMPLSELQNRKSPSSDSSDEDDVVLALLKPKKSTTSEKKPKNTGKASGKSSPSKTKAGYKVMIIFSIKTFYSSVHFNRV